MKSTKGWATCQFRRSRFKAGRQALRLTNRRTSSCSMPGPCKANHSNPSSTSTNMHRSSLSHQRTSLRGFMGWINSEWSQSTGQGKTHRSSILIQRPGFRVRRLIGYAITIPQTLQANTIRPAPTSSVLPKITGMQKHLFTWWRRCAKSISECMSKTKLCWSRCSHSFYLVPREYRNFKKIRLNQTIYNQSSIQQHPTLWVAFHRAN